MLSSAELAVYDVVHVGGDLGTTRPLDLADVVISIEDALGGSLPFRRGHALALPALLGLSVNTVDRTATLI